MKVMGLIGGMSWESSIEYYRIINQMVKLKLGDLHSCKCIMYSVDFSEIELLQHEGKWEELSNMMIDVAQNLVRAGAEFIIICTNTMHMMADKVQDSINVPVLHIADAVAEQIKAEKLKKVGLLGTRFTMEQDFYKDRIYEKYGIEVIIPSKEERCVIHDIIYNELVRGIIKPESKDKYKKIIQGLVEQGAEGVILGCTEIPILIKQEDINIRIFDSTTIHAEYAVKFALKN